LTTAIVTGASSGLGACIANRLRAVDITVHDWSLETFVDVSNEWVVQKLANDFKEEVNSPVNAVVDILVNCAGYNHMDYITDFPTTEWDKVMEANAKSIFLCTKYLAPLMVNGTICNIISSASEVPMTHSIAYNASKAAAAMMTRQMAKELYQTHGITVFGVSPAKMKNTGMSRKIDKRAADLRGITEEQAHEYQISKLLTGEEIDPDVCAEFIAWLLEKDHRHMYLAGCILEYGA